MRGGGGGRRLFVKNALFHKKMPFLANIECCPNFLEYALLILSIMKLVENLQVTSQIKVK